MAISMGNQGKKDLNVELNLLPIFDVLSVCICFLLMTVVWVQVGAMTGAQALGGQSAAETQKSPSVWITIDESQDIQLSFKNIKGNSIADKTIQSNKGQINWVNLKNSLELDKKVQMALIMPAKNTRYDQVIKVMDLVKAEGIKDVGLTPL